MGAERPTIVAIATPAGGGERALVRLSGARAKELAARVATGALDAGDFAGRGVRDLRVRDARGDQPARVVWMSAPRSYTGEDVVELHVLGSPPLVRSLLARLQELGAAPAEPGEFTRRAFEHGRLALDQAEGVLALVEASNAEAVRAAHELVRGGSAGAQARLREQLADLVALGVASLDFSEDETGHVPTEELARGAASVLAGLERLAAARARRSLERGQARVVLAGAPNAGKSSLFNRLAGERALVSPHAGTTRDPLRAELSDGHFTVELVDTPGLEPPSGAIATEAQALGLAARRAAALVAWVVDATTATAEGLSRERAALGSAVPVVLVWNKIDRAGAAAPPAGDELARLALEELHPVSAASGAGVGELARALVRRAALAETGLARELVARHQRSLDRAGDELGAALAGLGAGAPLDLVVEHLREALDALDDLSGRSTPDELLDRIFARFCIGK